VCLVIQMFTALLVLGWVSHHLPGSGAHTAMSHRSQRNLPGVHGGPGCSTMDPSLMTSPAAPQACFHLMSESQFINIFKVSYTGHKVSHMCLGWNN
jgi:hypothetical protein